uniref:Uncharacterized protein n=1 Tax=Amphora coffeiformis TaxID=265554 RepID=A0A7S3P4E4_9STRA|mmetsp:Transcript_13680/g.26241  ORF Transcript_13680/g.26241 Transcript_13680/m.26241 type:complete len:529 (+) Transcript_13680:105-1691(+)|eukprot:scaffold4603_cov175-Amphora_coffeaeformis.AAC.1
MKTPATSEIPPLGEEPAVAKDPTFKRLVSPTSSLNFDEEPSSSDEDDDQLKQKKQQRPSTKVPLTHGGGTTVVRSVQTKLDWLMSQVINSKNPTAQVRTQVGREAVVLYKDHVNSAFLDFRKSVEAQPDGQAVIEWSDGGNGFTDIEGNQYLDMLGGYGIYSVGHRHPQVIAAVQNQLQKQALHSQEMVDPLRAYLADVITKLARGHDEVLPGDLQYAFFTNSGTESVEGCLKAATLATGRHKYIGMIGGFHGKSLGALGGTSKGVFRGPFRPALANWEHVAFGDHKALEDRLKASEFTGDRVAAVFIEPILGEGGIMVPPDGYLKRVRELCDEYGAMLIFDEIQTGMGRTGTLFACQREGVQPDLMALAKGFGGGVMPIGAVLGNAKAWTEFNKNPFLHTTTFGGNPLGCAAALATIQVLLDEDLPRQASEKGEYLIPKLEELHKDFPHLLVEVRGRGLMIGLEFACDETGYAVSKEMFARHVLMGGTLINSKTLRVEPPLTISYEELDNFCNLLRESLEVLSSAQN